MKHLNPNLDNVTNVELKQDPTGAVKFIGVDGNNDIVEATLPSSVLGDSVNSFPENNRIFEGRDFYFDGAIGDFTSDCWREGATVTLTSTYTGHTNIEITGQIRALERQLNADGTSFETMRVIIDNAQNGAGSDNPFDGTTFGGTVDGVNFYEVQTGTGDTNMQYCLTAPGCGSQADLGVGFHTNSAQGGTGIILPLDSIHNSIDPEDDANTIYNSRRQDQFFFWGYDTEMDGTPIVHPDSGLPAIVIAERDSSVAAGDVGNVEMTEFRINRVNPPDQSYSSTDVTEMPDPNWVNWSRNTSNDPDTFTPISTNLLRRDPNNNNQFSIRGNLPWADPTYDAVPIGRTLRWSNRSLPEGSTSVQTPASSGNTLPRDGVHESMLNVGLASPLRLPNTTADRQPRGEFAPRSHRAKAFFVIAPGSTNTGLNFRRRYGNPRGTDNAPSYGWSPFYSIHSGSGATRASDGRYYVSANANDCSFYVNGYYSPFTDDTNTTRRNGSEDPHPSWTIKLDRTVYELTSVDIATGGSRNAGSTDNIVRRFQNFRRVLDRDANPLGSQSPKTFGDNVDGVDVVTPPDDVTDEGTEVRNVMAYTSVTDDQGNRATADEVMSNLHFEAGDNITITVSDNPDTVRIESTDRDSITTTVNQLDGTAVIDVSGASTTNNITVPAGSSAWVSPTEIYINNTGVDVVVNDTPSNFIFDKITLESGQDIIDVSGASTTLEIVIPNNAIARVSDTEAYLNLSGNDLLVNDTPANFFSPVPAGIRAVGDGACMLRVGADTVNTNAVIDASGASLSQAVVIPDGSVAWLSATEQYWNTSGDNQIVISNAVSDYTSPTWLKLGDGTGTSADNEFGTITIDDTAANNVVADQEGDTLNLRGAGSVTLTSDPNTDTITITGTDNAATTTIQNTIDGTDIIVVTDGVAVDIPAGDIAYLSPTHLFLNTTGSTINVNSTDPTNYPAPDWLRIGGDAINDDSVYNVSNTDATTVVLVPSGAIGWISPTEQYWNDTGVNQFVSLPTDITNNVSTDTTAGWRRMADGDAQLLFNRVTVTDTNQPASATIDILADSTTDTLNFVAGDGITLTTDSNADSLTIATRNTTVNTDGTTVVEPDCIFRPVIAVTIFENSHSEIRLNAPLTYALEVGRTVQFFNDSDIMDAATGTLTDPTTPAAFTFTVRADVVAGSDTIQIVEVITDNAGVNATSIYDCPNAFMVEGDTISDGDLCVNGNILLQGRLFDKNGQLFDCDVLCNRDDGDGGGGGDDIVMDGGDLTNQMGNTSFCYTITGELDPCYVVGSLVQIEKSGTGVTTQVANATVTSITTTPATTANNDTSPDCWGCAEGQIETSGPFYEWEFVRGNLAQNEFGRDTGRRDDWIDWQWNYPHIRQGTADAQGRSEWTLINIQDRTNTGAQVDGILNQPSAEYDYYNGARIHGTIASTLYGGTLRPAQSLHDTPVGQTVQINPGSQGDGVSATEGSVTLRKVRRLTTKPAPQRWVYGNPQGEYSNHATGALVPRTPFTNIMFYEDAVYPSPVLPTHTATGPLGEDPKAQPIGAGLLRKMPSTAGSANFDNGGIELRHVWSNRGERRSLDTFQVFNHASLTSGTTSLNINGVQYFYVEQAGYDATTDAGSRLFDWNTASDGTGTSLCASGGSFFPLGTGTAMPASHEICVEIQESISGGDFTIDTSNTSRYNLGVSCSPVDLEGPEQMTGDLNVDGVVCQNAMTYDYTVTNVGGPTFFESRNYRGAAINILVSFTIEDETMANLADGAIIGWDLRASNNGAGFYSKLSNSGNVVTLNRVSGNITGIANGLVATIYHSGTCILDGCISAVGATFDDNVRIEGGLQVIGIPTGVVKSTDGNLSANNTLPITERDTLAGTHGLIFADTSGFPADGTTFESALDVTRDLEWNADTNTFAVNGGVDLQADLSNRIQVTASPTGTPDNGSVIVAGDNVFVQSDDITAGTATARPALGVGVAGEVGTTNVGLNRTGVQAPTDSSTPAPSTATLTVWSGTQAQYDAIVAQGTVDANTLYMTT